MKLLKKVKDIYRVIIADTKQDKIDALFEHIIDKIEIIDDNVHIKTKKNIVIENYGHTVVINKGMNVNIAKQIHLNPKIDFQGFDILEFDLQTAYEIEMKKLEDKYKGTEFKVHDCNKKKQLA
jgi:hypothetical protein